MFNNIRVYSFLMLTLGLTACGTVHEAFKIVNGRISYMWAPAFDEAPESGWPGMSRP